MRLSRPQIWQIWLAVGFAAMVLYAVVPPFKGSGPWMNILSFSPVAGILIGQRWFKPENRKPWLFFALGFFFFWLGDIYTYTYPRVFGGDVPFPSPGDAFYVAVYPALMAGLLILVRRRNPGTDQSGVIDSLIITAGFALLAWVALIAPYVHDDTLDVIGKGVSISYPMGDVLLLAAAIRLMVGSGAKNMAFYLITGSIVTLLVTDFVYGLMVLAGTFDFQWWLDWGWITCYLLWGAGALHPSMRELDAPAVGRPPRLTRLRLFALTVASLIAPGVLIVHEAGSDNFDMVVVVATSVILVGLVVARMSGLVHEQERSADRERVLNSAGAELVSATDRTEIHEAALNAIHAFVGDKPTTFICDIEDRSVLVMAVGEEELTGQDPRRLKAKTSAALLRAISEQLPVLHLDESMREDLGTDSDHSEALVLTLRTGTTSLIVIASSEPIPRAIQGSLSALATQVSLALDTAALTEEMHRRTSEARFGSLVRHSSDLITVLDSDFNVVYQSPSIENVLGYTPDQIVGTRFDRLLPTHDKARLGHLLADDAAAGNGETQVIECGLDHADGTTRQFEILHTNLLADEHVQGIVLNCRDVSERKAFEEQLAHQAFHDPVTNLANRALFSERVRHAVARTRRGRNALGVVFVDLDDFKTVNDSLGHSAGDQVLIQVGQRLSASIRASDTAARFGGDEFAILLEDLESPQEAADAAERMLETLAAPLQVDDKEIFIRASIGIAVMEAGRAADAQELIRDADVAMYKAKRDGKGTYRLFEPEMHAGVLDRLELRGDLQRALSLDQFELDYQPIVRLSDGSITGFEALVRWRHPQRGLLAPDWFIPLAEETGLIVPLGNWVLEEACSKAVQMQAHHHGEAPLSMSVNLSLKQLQHPDCIGQVQAALDGCGLAPADLTLEITETLMMTDPDLAIERLADLKAIGVSLAMDDFGTGYSSLSYLSRFPVDELKMDRSFLREGASPKTSSLTAAVLALGQSLNLTVVAEGIEHREQWMTLRDLGCQLGQGFYFARPMNAESAIEFLQARTNRAAELELDSADLNAT
ncbi:MAG TPA: EAL domain-containing protein [Baekduia sp.]|nr:EAL domain-containing protein [Baekduia sp.]